MLWSQVFDPLEFWNKLFFTLVTFIFHWFDVWSTIVPFESNWSDKMLVTILALVKLFFFLVSYKKNSNINFWPNLLKCQQVFYSIWNTFLTKITRKVHIYLLLFLESIESIHFWFLLLEIVEIQNRSRNQVQDDWLKCARELCFD